MADISARTLVEAPQNPPQVNMFDEMKKKWPSPFVSRDRIYEFTNGLFKQSSMNTLDARGAGINIRYSLGAKVFYEVDDVVEWLKTKIKRGKNERV